jgi:hypothetical protein
MGMPSLLSSYLRDRAFRLEDDLFIGADAKVSYNKSKAFVEKKQLMTPAISRSKKSS